MRNSVERQRLDDILRSANHEPQEADSLRPAKVVGVVSLIAIAGLSFVTWAPVAWYVAH